jgi:hypothetical protein
MLHSQSSPTLGYGSVQKKMSPLRSANPMHARAAAAGGMGPAGSPLHRSSSLGAAAVESPASKPQLHEEGEEGSDPRSRSPPGSSGSGGDHSDAGEEAVKEEPFTGIIVETSDEPIVLRTGEVGLSLCVPVQ